MTACPQTLFCAQSLVGTYIEGARNELLDILGSMRIQTRIRSVQVQPVVAFSNIDPTEL